MNNMFYLDKNQENLARQIEMVEKMVFPHPWNFTQILGHLQNAQSQNLYIMGNAEQKEDYVFCQTGNGPIWGYCLGLCLGQVKEAEILRFAVHPSLQRARLGSGLLEAWENALMLKFAPCINIFLEVSEKNPHAIAFYKKSKYQEMERRKKYYQDGSDAIIMKKIIS